MQNLSGYIKLFRKLVRWGWYRDSAVKCLFLHFLLTASFKDFEWMGLRLKAGQLVTSRRQLALELNLTEGQIRTAMNKLITTGEITCNPTNKFTVVTIANWGEYQTVDSEHNQQDGNPPTDQQPHRNNNKKINNLKKKEDSLKPPTLEAIKLYCVKADLPDSLGEKFFEYYEQMGWRTARGTDIRKCWKSKLLLWQKSELDSSPAATAADNNKMGLDLQVSYDRELVNRLINSDD